MKWIFIRYCEETNSYRLYNPKTEKLLARHDVLFDEKEETQWNQDVQLENPRIIVQEEKYFISKNLASSPNTS